jgi:DNA-binding response OmpR family regulator
MIDDDTKLVALLGEFLKPFGFEVIGAGDGPAGLALLESSSPDAVILDGMLPGWDGFEVCRRIRAFSSVPLIMLSARGETVDRIVGLELGADDYLPKPFEPRELASRIQSLLRRSRGTETAERLTVPGLTISKGAREAYDAAGTPLGLTSMEFDLLWLLASHPGQRFSRDAILNALQGVNADVYSRSVDILVSRLRAKLRDHPKSPRFIQSSRGWGYAFRQGIS